MVSGPACKGSGVEIEEHWAKEDNFPLQHPSISWCQHRRVCHNGLCHWGVLHGEGWLTSLLCRREQVMIGSGVSSWWWWCQVVVMVMVVSGGGGGGGRKFLHGVGRSIVGC